jgi:hypothetical protein
MKRRQETVTEGKLARRVFEAMASGRNLGRKPRIGALPFLMLKADVASLSKISRGHATKEDSR